MAISQRARRSPTANGALLNGVCDVLVYGGDGGAVPANITLSSGWKHTFLQSLSDTVIQEKPPFRSCYFAFKRENSLTLSLKEDQ